MSELPEPEDTGNHPSPGRARVSAVRLFLALALPPGAWLVQLISSYFFASRGCDPTGDLSEAHVVSGLWLVLLLINLACLAAGATGAWLAYSAWARSKHEKPGGKRELLDVGEGRTRFVALCALIVSGIFLTAIPAEAAALLILQRCAPGTWFS